MERSNGMSGESFVAMIVRVTSGVTMVGTGGGKSISSSIVPHPSSNGSKACFSNRPAGFPTAPRPFRGARGAPPPEGSRGGLPVDSAAGRLPLPLPRVVDFKALAVLHGRVHPPRPPMTSDATALEAHSQLHLDCASVRDLRRAQKTRSRS